MAPSATPDPFAPKAPDAPGASATPDASGAAKPDASDVHAARAALNAEMRALPGRLPREQWHRISRGSVASVWLSMHASLRRGQRDLDGLAARWQQRSIDWLGFRSAVLPLIDAHIGHLHGHHRLEDRHYFPSIRRADPRVAHGINLLDSDHHAMDDTLGAIFALQRRMHALVPIEAAAWTTADELARRARLLTPLLLQHLDDEEEIVIPVLARDAIDDAA